MTLLDNNDSMQERDLASQAWHERFLIGYGDPILVTGATGFIGCSVVDGLFDIRLVRSSSNVSRLKTLSQYMAHEAPLEIIAGSLLSREDCNFRDRQRRGYHLPGCCQGGEVIPRR